MATHDSPSQITHAMREKLNRVRRCLLGLHKSILDAERESYERERGRIASPHVLLQLVMNDPWFGWFRPLSDILVRIDELLEGHTPTQSDQQPDTTPPPPSDTDAEAILRELRSLLQPAEEGEEFATKYKAVLQRTPDIILAHAELTQLLE